MPDEFTRLEIDKVEVIDANFAGNVQVMDLSEALYVTKGDLGGATCIVVTTLQALRVEDTEGRKVYESAGALQPHFGGLSSSLESKLESENLAVEYKGEDRWSNDDSKEERAVGELWSVRSRGKCLFVMPKGKDWNAVDHNTRGYFTAFSAVP